MAKSNTPVPVGQVVLVSKPPAAVEQPKIREISQKQYEKLRPKKELSEKQKENLAKLVERNKQRAIERRVVVTDALPESVPEDHELVVVKPKRSYMRKTKNEINYPSESEQETEEETEESESEVEVRKPLPSKHKRTTKPKKPAKKPVQKYRYDTETTTDDSSDEDFSEDEDPKVKKYQAKAQARLKAVQAIDQRMSQIQGNIYTSRNLSVF